MGRSLVIYRRPNDGDRCFVAEFNDADVKYLRSYRDVGNEPCFVFAPFNLSEDNPVILFCNNEFKTDTLQELKNNVHGDILHNRNGNDYGEKTSDFKIVETIEYPDIYKKDFSFFHASTSSGRIKKIVLARSMKINYTGTPDIIELYIKACRNNPEAFVTLVSSNICGTWLIATPEVLLEQENNRYHTMSLAGTMKLDNDIMEAVRTCSDISETWSKKNIEEQQIVSSYIEKILNEYSDDVCMTGPRSIVAGNVVHLRSDFDFSTNRADIKIGDILESLHPTPAVCGMPVEESKKIILCKEHVRRKYYSGFCGPIDNNGGTHLFVTLRCMQIHDKCFELFAGGGILPESSEADEWNETLYKMQAMMRSIGL